MQKLFLHMLSAVMLSGLFIASDVQAQKGPCGYDFTTTVSNPTCAEVCNGSILLVPNQAGVFDYMWSNGVQVNSISSLCAGTYTVTVADDKKCEEVYEFTLVDPEPMNASCTTLQNESAPGAMDGMIQGYASGGDGNYTFEWQTVPVVMGDLLSGVGAGSYTVIVYDGNDCMAMSSCTIETEKKDECGGFRTQTQGGWGQCQQNGNNPGTYLFANFDAAFPSDLIIGCGNRKLKLTSAQAVCDFLPSGTSPKQLRSGTLVDPGQNYRNVLAGQLVTATINVVFDAYDPDFGSSETLLGDLIITSGSFAGWTVNELLAEANRRIGSCGSAYSYGTINDALDALNNNYDDGIMDNGFLTCPDEKKPRVQHAVAPSAPEFKMNVFPNPVSGTSNLSIETAQDEMVDVQMFNVAGQKAVSLYKGEVKAGDILNLSINGANLESGFYLIKVVTAGNVYTQKIVVKN